MASAFQSNAFQNSAFQITSSGNVGAGGGTGAGAGIGRATARSIGSGAGIGAAAGVSAGNVFWDPTAQGYVDRSFGMFIVFGLSTFKDEELGDGTSDKNDFNPGTTANPQQWVDVAVAAGCRYINVVTRHVDGFFMCPDTTTTTYGIGSTTWYANNGQRDLIQEVITAATAVGIVVNLYYAGQDKNWELTHDKDDATAYHAHHVAQLSVLLNRYNPVGAIWFDAINSPYFGAHTYPFPWASFGQRLSDVKSIQPDCLITDNNQHTSLSESELIIYEGGVIGAAVPPGNTDPAEKCETVYATGDWFYKTTPPALRTVPDLFSELTYDNANNAAFVLNAIVDRTGVIETRIVNLMTALGDLIENNFIGAGAGSGAASGIGKATARGIGSGAGVGTGRAGASSATRGLGRGRLSLGLGIGL